MQPTSSFPPNQNINGVYGSEGAQIFVGHAGRDVIFSRSKDQKGSHPGYEPAKGPSNTLET